MKNSPRKTPQSDGAVDALAQKLVEEKPRVAPSHPGKCLWIADEHPLPKSVFQTLSDQVGIFLSNRFDQHQLAKKNNLESYFSDYDLSEIGQQPIDGIFFRTAKERPVVHRVINEAKRVLPDKGTFWIAGYKNEGIKTHIQRAEEPFGCKAEITRHKNQLYVAKLTQHSAETDPLTDNDYSELREIRSGDFDFWTKPGLYGWDKVDQASKYLMDWLSENQESFEGKRVLDLGCGYGYLSMRAAALGGKEGAEEIVATDNCAAALTACEKNLSDRGIQARVLESNAGAEINGTFDIILCNPPFHQGFSTTGDLHQRFIKETKRLLAPNGKAWFVVNQFLDIESLVANEELSCLEKDRTKSFKILRLHAFK